MKAKVASENTENQIYATLPELSIFTHERLKSVALVGYYDEFSLSYSFSSNGEYKDAKFVNEDEFTY